MTNHTIHDWIKRSRLAGKTDKQIKEELMENGWSGVDVRQAFAAMDDRSGAKVVKKTSSSKVLGLPIAVVIVILLAGGLYYAHDAYDIFNTNQSNTNNTNTTIPSSGTLPSISTQLAAQGELKQFASYDEVGTFIENNAAADSYGYFGGGNFRNALMIDEVAMPKSDAIGESFSLGVADSESGQATTVEYSETNIQVAGVDEADIVKTDGKFVYTVSENNLYIVDVQTTTPVVVATIIFENQPQNIYVTDDRLVVYGQDWSIDDRAVFDTLRSTSFTYLKIFDISDRSNPSQLQHLDFEGYYSQSRMIGDYVYFVTSQSTYTYYDDNPLPLLLEDDVVVPLSQTATGYAPDVYYIDMPYYAQNFTTVSAINVADTTAPVTSDIYLLSGAETMYVSLDNMYIAYTKYVSEEQLTLDILKGIITPQLSANDQQRIADIEKSPNHVLSMGEKTAKIMTILQRYASSLDSAAEDKLNDQIEKAVAAAYEDISKELEKTVIHRIGIDKDAITYAASGEVTGHVLNQFSMDEHNGYFRIATTKSRSWSQFGEGGVDSYNNLYILDSAMQQVGKVENLAEGEQIYSVRFMQGRAYLVTFRQIDPLFAIDVSDPTNPTVLGELKVPGFSSYLHPYDETLLIGFGKQADESGRVTGLKISLFDVSDVDDLKEVDTYEMGDAGSDSIALNDHKAFLFHKDTNLLVVPVSLRESTDDSFGAFQTHGAMVFRITPEGFEFRDRIDHSDGSSDDNEIEYHYSYQYYNTMVKRSFFIDELLYTVSNKFLKAHALSDLTEQSSLELSSATSDFVVQ